jgi:hypothetical protein
MLFESIFHLFVKAVVVSKSSGRLAKYGLSCTSPFSLPPANLARILYLNSRKPSSLFMQTLDKDSFIAVHGWRQKNRSQFVLTLFGKDYMVVRWDLSHKAKIWEE